LKVKEGQSSHTNTTMTSSDPAEFAQQVSSFVKKLNENAQQIKASLTNKLSKAATREANLKAQIAALKHHKEVSDTEGGDTMHVEKPHKSKTPPEEKAAAKRRKVLFQNEAEISKEGDIP
jgi:small-conductance mechanosensitive channel